MNVFAATSAVLSFALVFVSGLLVPALGVLSYRRFGAGMALIGATFAGEALFMDSGGIRLGIVLYYTDLVFLFIASVGAARLLVASDFPRRHVGWIVFCAAVLLSLCTGLVAHGSTAGVQAREYFYFVASGLYAMSFGMTQERIRLLFDLLAGMGLLLLALCVYRWVVYYAPIPQLLPAEGSYNVDGPIRVIHSNEALVLAQLLVASLFFATGSRGLTALRALSPIVLSAVLALQHRSVWLAGLVGVMVAFLVQRARGGAAVMQVMLIAGIVAVTAMPLALSSKLSGVSQQVGHSAANALAGAGTAGERLSSWRLMIGNWAGAGPRSVLIGQSFGTSNARYVADQTNGGLRRIDYQAHNFYVQTLTNTGLVGLASFLTVAGYVVLGLYRMCRLGVGGACSRALLVMLVMQFAYYVPYGVDYLQCLLLGAAMAYVATHDTEARPSKVQGAWGAWRRWGMA